MSFAKFGVGQATGLVPRRIVLDTGVLVCAAIRAESVPALALEKALLQFEVCASKATLAELDTVLRRNKFDRYAALEIRNNFMVEFCKRVSLFEVTLVVSDCIDPKDNMFLALAQTAQAELIVSSDQHLTDMHPWKGIPIMPPAAFLVGIR